MQLAPMFSNGMVLQRERPIYVFGEGEGSVSVTFLGEERRAQAAGRFFLEFTAREAGGPYEMTVVMNGEESVIRDVMIGEVILVAGQSNAQLTIGETYDRDTAFSQDDSLRYYAVTRPTLDEAGNFIPQETPFNECWTALTGQNANGWSAIGLHTGLYLRKKLGMAVGVVACFKGASVIEAFLSEKACAIFPIDPQRQMIDHSLDRFRWNRYPAFLYHYMLEKLVPYQVSSVLWYQGESNRHPYEGTYYDRMLKTMIGEWRDLFLWEALPFVIVQINFFPGNPPEEGVRAIMDAQEKAAEQTENAMLVRISDMGEWEKIHPENKRQVAERICAALEKLVYAE